MTQLVIGDKTYDITKDGVKAMDGAVLLAAYNQLTGKTIKGFHTRAKGEEQTLAAFAKAQVKPAEQPVTNGAASKAALATTSRGVRTSNPRRAPGGPRAVRNAAYPTGFTPEAFKIAVKPECKAKNPKRHGTNAEKIFQILCRYDGKTVKHFVENTTNSIAELGARPMGELSYCLGKGFVSLVPVGAN